MGVHFKSPTILGPYEGPSFLDTPISLLVNDVPSMEGQRLCTRLGRHKPRESTSASPGTLLFSS